MSAVRTFFKWIMRAGLVAMMILLLAWAEMRISRAYHLRAARQPPSAFIVENSPLIALIHARIIDGTASPAIEDQTVIIDGGKIADVRPSSSVSVPPSARVIDLTGKTVFPGLVMMHEHLHYFSQQHSFEPSPNRAACFVPSALPCRRGHNHAHCRQH